MKLQTQKLTGREYDGHYVMLSAAMEHHGIPVYPQAALSTTFFNGDLIPAANVNDARWIFSRGYIGSTIFKIGNDGTLIQLIRA